MIVGFDLDGVLYPWHEEVWKWFVRRNIGASLVKGGEDFSFIDFWKWPNGWIARNEDTDFVKVLVKETLPYVSAQANEADVSILHDMVRDFNTEIYYITSRPERLQYDTAKWLRDGDFPFANNLIMADGNGGKVKVVKEVGCKYFVEDRPKYLGPLSEVTTVFKMVTPYNTYQPFPAVPVGNIYQVYDYIKEWERL